LHETYQRAVRLIDDEAAVEILQEVKLALQYLISPDKIEKLFNEQWEDEYAKKKGDRSLLTDTDILAEKRNGTCSS
jgi:hypothetical protein